MHDNTAQPSTALPIVSVVIPAFKAASHIRMALDSVFAQAYTDFEVIVVNDGSPDTEQMEQAIASYLPRILYLKQENRGPSAARNTAIRHARGEFVAFLDSDDSWLPSYLAKQLGLLRTSHDVDMVYCDALLEGDTDDNGKSFMQLYPSIGAVTFESVLIEQTQIVTSGTVVRRQKILEAGLFDEDIHYAEDHDLWLRLLYAGGKVQYQREVLLRRRVRSDSHGSAPGMLLAGTIQSLTKLDRDLDLSEAMHALIAKRLQAVRGSLALIEGKELLLAGEREKSLEMLKRSQELSPSFATCAILIGLRIAPGFTIRSARFWRNRKGRAAASNSSSIKNAGIGSLLALL
jgi:glycosyltransferase involved in cell wall biosynthesis